MSAEHEVKIAKHTGLKQAMWIGRLLRGALGLTEGKAFPRQHWA